MYIVALSSSESSFVVFVDTLVVFVALIEEDTLVVVVESADTLVVVVESADTLVAVVGSSVTVIAVHPVNMKYPDVQETDGLPSKPEAHES